MEDNDRTRNDDSSNRPISDRTTDNWGPITDRDVDQSGDCIFRTKEQNNDVIVLERNQEDLNRTESDMEIDQSEPSDQNSPADHENVGQPKQPIRARNTSGIKTGLILDFEI